MASKIRNNCPTSDREGKCVEPAVSRDVLFSIERVNGDVFAPTNEDRAAAARFESQFFIPNSIVCAGCEDDLPPDWDSEGWLKKGDLYVCPSCIQEAKNDLVQQNAIREYQGLLPLPPKPQPTIILQSDMTDDDDDMEPKTSSPKSPPASVPAMALSRIHHRPHKVRRGRFRNRIK